MVARRDPVPAPAAIAANEAVEPDSPAAPPHDPEQVASQLAAKLAARTRHVTLLIGAGASKAAGLPDLAELRERVLSTLDGAALTEARRLLAHRDLEAGLTRLRRVSSLLTEGEEFDGLSKETARDLEKSLTHGIAHVIGSTETSLDAHLQLAGWAASAGYQLPLEIFTSNYDLLIERALEELGVAYFDGYVGNLEGRFRADLVDAVDPSLDEALPRTFVRLWKLHGSINWTLVERNSSREIVRLGSIAPEGTTAAIYPSEEKYDASRRLPFVALMDRLRRALEQPESLTVTVGYSFGDQHLNEVIFDAAIRHPRSETLALCFGSIPDSLVERALLARNVTALGATEGVIGGRRSRWSGSDVPGVSSGGHFLLGDFSYAAAFLGRGMPSAQGDEDAGG